MMLLGHCPEQEAWGDCKNIAAAMPVLPHQPHTHHERNGLPGEEMLSMVARPVKPSEIATNPKPKSLLMRSGRNSGRFVHGWRKRFARTMTHELQSIKEEKNMTRRGVLSRRRAEQRDTFVLSLRVASLALFWQMKDVMILYNIVYYSVHSALDIFCVQ